MPNTEPQFSEPVQSRVDAFIWKLKGLVNLKKYSKQSLKVVLGAIQGARRKKDPLSRDASAIESLEKFDEIIEMGDE